MSEIMGGRVVLEGNISPINIFNGTAKSVFEETMEAIEVFALHRGYIVMDGANIPPGSPVENINAMYEASVHYQSMRLRGN